MRFGLLHPGAMGTAIGRLLDGDVVWTGAGRSAATRARAGEAGFVEVGTLGDLVRSVDAMISLCPPAAAYEVAEAAYDAGFEGVYLDANAVSPRTAGRIAGMFRRFVDGGVIGPPPGPGRSSRLYLSGPHAGAAARWFTADLDVRVVDGGIGAASALKMMYAGWTKGSAALLAAIRAGAAATGVEASLLEEWAVSQPHLVDRSGRMGPGLAAKAWRFEGEMREIAATMAAAGLPRGFHDAAAEVYERLAPLRDAPDGVDVAGIVEALLDGGE